MKLNNLTKSFALLCASTAIASCASYYEDEVIPPTEQEIQEAYNIKPRSSFKKAKFHMSSVKETSSVVREEPIRYKRKNLPPFNISYVGKNLEQALLEIANIAGESIVLPEGISDHTVTLVHSGGDFRETLELILAKAGYHYNYDDGIWYITKYPVRRYVLELGQSERSGSLAGAEVSSSGDDDSDSDSDSAEQIETQYTDELWAQVEGAMEKLIAVGSTSARSGSASQSAGLNASGIVDGSAASNQLTPPNLDGNQPAGGVLAGLGTGTTSINTAAVGDFRAPSEQEVEPWFSVSKSTGVIVVRAAPEAHREIEKYLEEMQSSALRQVYVDARIIAVIKDKDTTRGANIGLQDGISSSLLGKVGFSAASPVSRANLTGGFIDFSGTGGDDIDAVIQSLSEIGDVYTISSPSIMVRNNQIARVSATRQLGYAETQVEQNTNSDGDVVIGTRTDEAKFKNAGTVMTVHPFVGRENVQMRFRLSISSQSGQTEIRTRVGTAADQTVTNFVPELQRNLIDQDMAVKYGQIYAIGSVIETSTNIDASYIPGLTKIPGVSEILRKAANSKQDTEFIVLVKVNRA